MSETQIVITAVFILFMLNAFLYVAVELIGIYADWRDRRYRRKYITQ